VFDANLTQVIVALMTEGLIDLHRTAQDGTRVRTWAGANSFRRLTRGRRCWRRPRLTSKR
jgi:hypothetical protein